MADVRFCVGFSKACKQAREGGGLPGSQLVMREVLADGCVVCVPRRRWLPPDIIRLIDALVRRLEHEDTLLSMNGGVLGTTLCEAAAAGGLRDVRFLLQRGADVEATTVFVNPAGRQFNWTALVWAAHAGKLAVCVALLDAGAGELDNALYNSSGSGHTQVVALLLDRGANVDVDAGATPLVIASQDGHLATVTLLLDRGADVHSEDDRPLRLAAALGRLDVVRLLLDHGADIHALEDASLGLAADNGRLEIVRLLLDRGADIHADNEWALRIARQNGHAAVVALLLERGALEPEEEDD